MSIKVINLNRIAYATALNIQKKLFIKVSQAKECKKNYLLLVEHEPVYTVGIRKQQYIDEEFQSKLKRLGADFVVTNRGGLITYHGIGQLVAYPIINMKDFPKTKQSIKHFVCLLESVLIDVCSDFAISASRLDGLPGVWVGGERKIAAIGIHASRYVTMHGVALNCNVDLDWFSHIVPCGIADKSVTSISNELQQNVDIDRVIPRFIHHFCRQLDCSISE